MAQKINHWLLITLVLSLGFGQLLRIEYQGAVIYLHDILVVLIMMINVKRIFRPEMWRYPGFTLIIVGLAVGWIRSLINIPPLALIVPALYLARLLSYLSLFLLVRNLKLVMNREVFILSGLTTLIIGGVQYFFMPDMRVFQYLGWDDHLNRLILPHFDPTFTGIMLCLLFFVFNRKQLLAAVVTILAILATYARSVFLSLAATELIVRRKLYLVAIILIFGLITIYGKSTQFGEGTNLLRSYSIESRIARDRAILRSLKGNLITGIGYNLFSGDIPSESEKMNHAPGPNSSYVLILATSGILGLSGWFIFLRQLYRDADYPQAVLFVILASFFNNVLFYPFVMLWIFLLPTSSKKGYVMVPSEV